MADNFEIGLHVVPNNARTPKYQLAGSYDHQGTLHVVDQLTGENRHYTQETLRFALAPDGYDSSLRRKLLYTPDIFGGPGDWPTRRFPENEIDLLRKEVDLLRAQLRVAVEEIRYLSKFKTHWSKFKTHWLGRIYLWLNKTK